MSVEVELIVSDSKRFYRGVEYDADGKIVSTAWLRTVEEPYLAGRAVRVRIRDKAYHFGVCRETDEFARDVGLTAEEIGSWGSDSDSS